jgi:hypothetical protein
MKKFCIDCEWLKNIREIPFYADGTGIMGGDCGVPKWNNLKTVSANYGQECKEFRRLNHGCPEG